MLMSMVLFWYSPWENPIGRGMLWAIIALLFVLIVSGITVMAGMWTSPNFISVLSFLE